MNIESNESKRIYNLLCNYYVNSKVNMGVEKRVPLYAPLLKKMRRKGMSKARKQSEIAGLYIRMVHGMISITRRMG